MATNPLTACTHTEEGEEEDVMPPGFDASSLASAMDDLALAFDDLDLPVDF